MNLVVNGAHVDSSTLSYSSTTVRYGARPIVDKSVSSFEDWNNNDESVDACLSYKPLLDTLALPRIVN